MTSNSASLPVPDFDLVPVGSLSSRIQSLDIQQVEQLIGYERNHACRVQVLDMLEHRRDQLDGREADHSERGTEYGDPSTPDRDWSSPPRNVAERSGHRMEHSRHPAWWGAEIEVFEHDDLSWLDDRRCRVCRWKGNVGRRCPEEAGSGCRALPICGEDNRLKGTLSTPSRQARHRRRGSGHLPHLRAGDEVVKLGPGDLVAVPPQRHDVEAVEPSVLLLPVALHWSSFAVEGRLGQTDGMRYVELRRHTDNDGDRLTPSRSTSAVIVIWV